MLFLLVQECTDLSALVLQSSQTLQLVGSVISANQSEGTNVGLLDAEPLLMVLVEQISRMKFHSILQTWLFSGQLQCELK